MPQPGKPELHAERVNDHVAVIYCTFCGHRWARTLERGGVTTTWRMTPHEVIAMQHELSKVSCSYCKGSIHVRIVDRRGPLASS